MLGFFKKRSTGPKLDRSQIVPRIKNKRFIEAAKSAGVPEEQMPFTESLVGELIVTYAFDLPDAFMMARPDQLAELNLRPEEVRALAIENLKRQITKISLQEIANDSVQEPHSVFRVVLGDNLDACAILSKGIWSGQAQKLSGKLIAQFPHRDWALYCDSESPASLSQMQAIAQRAFDVEDPHVLSLDLLEWTGQGWQVHEA